MIFEAPPDRIIQSADVIALFDLHQRGRQQVIFRTGTDEQTSPMSRLVVDIPVDLNDAAAVQRWKDRIATVRSCPS